jgi:uncharacterized protein (DUF58 family)
MTIMLALLAHSIFPHPALRVVVVLLVFGLIFALLGAALYARYRRQVELSNRLKSLEDKLDRLTAPSTTPASK